MIFVCSSNPAPRLLARPFLHRRETVWTLWLVLKMNDGYSRKRQDKNWRKKSGWTRGCSVESGFGVMHRPPWYGLNFISRLPWHSGSTRISSGTVKRVELSKTASFYSLLFFRAVAFFLSYSLFLALSFHRPRYIFFSHSLFSIHINL